MSTDSKIAEVLRGYIEDYKSEDGMFDTKHYARQFQEALAAHGAEQEQPKLYTSPKLRALIDGVAEQEQAGEAVAWLVIDSTGQPMHAAWWEAAAHEHINDAINEYDLHEASEWRVVPVYSRPLEPLNQTKLIALWADKSDGPSNAEIVSFARAIERAHGITEDTK